MDFRDKTMIAVAAAMLLATGCVPDDPPEQTSVDHDTVQKSISMHSEAVVDSLVEGVELMEASAMVDDYAGGDGCVGYPEGEDVVEPDQDYGECGGGGTDSGEVRRELSGAEDFLLDRIFTEENVESEEGDAVTYLLEGDVVCDSYETSQGTMVDEECVEDVDALEIRLRAVKYTSGSLEIDLMVGPDEVQPLSFGFSATAVTTTAIFDNLQPAVDHLEEVVGDDMAEFPDQFSGTVRAGIYDEAAGPRIGVEVLDDVDISSDGELDLYVEAVGEVLSLGADTAGQHLEFGVDFGEVGLTARDYRRTSVGAVPPEEQDEDDEWTDPEESDEPETVEFGVDLEGLTSTVSFDPTDDRVEFEDVGIGGGPASLSVAGETVVELDLDAGVGGVFDAVVDAGPQGLQLDVEPGVELQLALMFHRVAGDYDDVDDWMLDEVLTMALKGDSNPAVRLGEQGLEVLRGHLSMEADNGPSATAYAGQCMIDESEPIVVDESGGVDTDGDYETSLHPFDGLEAGQCQ